MPRTPKPPGTQTPSTSAERAARRPRGSAQSSEGTQRILTRASWAKPPARSASVDRQVGVGQVDVLADQRDGDLVRRAGAPGRSRSSHSVQSTSRNGRSEPAHDVGVEALAVQHLRDVVDRRRVGGGDHGLVVDVAHQRDLALDARPGSRRSERQHDRVGLDADAAQRGDRVLGRLGLQLAGRADVGHQRDVQEEAVVPADVVADLAGGLEERQRLDVADGAADLGDHHVEPRPGPRPSAAIRALISLVMCGMTCTVSPRYSPRRSLAITVGVDLAGGDVRRCRPGRCRGSARSGRCRGRSRRRPR